MIINSLTAENLLKYRRLDLDNLPTHGIIAISGCNESGKSSVGEAICFALFGRTFAVKPTESRKLIRWGESRCSVILGFSLKDGIYYRLSRSLDRDNNHSVRLYRTNDPNHPVARGVDQVAAAVEGLLGYDFGAFVDSFYLAQREITTPHPHGHAIHIMAGIVPLMVCSRELQTELEHDKFTQKDLVTRSADIKGQISDLAFDAKHSHILVTDQSDLTNREKHCRNNKQLLEEIAAEYQKRVSRQQQDVVSRRWIIRLLLVSLLLAIAGLGAWTWLTLYTDQPLATNILPLIETLVPSQWLLYGGLTSTLVTALSWAHIFTLNRRRKALQITGGHLADILAALDDLEIGLPKTLRAKPDSSEIRLRKNPAVLKEQDLQQRLSEARVTAQEAEDLVAKKSAWLNETIMRIGRRQAELHQKLLHEAEQRQINERLINLSAALSKEDSELQQHIKILIQAEDLLQGAMRHLYHRFNHHLRGLASKTLPMFTDNRYQHLHITEDLTVRAFSNEKRDFMELDEVSSGTQRQVMLALRLSLSQQLIDRVVRGSQFLFLDEPFAFFDEARTRSALMALPLLSKDITQIWVVAQQFPEDLKFDRVIQCRRDCDEYSDAESSRICVS